MLFAAWATSSGSKFRGQREHTRPVEWLKDRRPGSQARASAQSRTWSPSTRAKCRAVHMATPNPWASAMAPTAMSMSSIIYSRDCGRRAGSSDPELRIQRVAKPVADQIDGERGERQRGARQRRQPPRDVKEVAALRQHAAPRRRRRLHAEAEKADRRLPHDELRELQSRDHHDGGRTLRQE